MVTEEYFDPTELAEIKMILSQRNVPFKKDRTDPYGALQLPNYTFIFFYKNTGEKHYSAGISSNECDVKYLTSYTPDLNLVLDLIQDHIHRKYVVYQTYSNCPRARHKIQREIEEYLNENGIECKPHISNALLLPNDIDLMYHNEHGMVQFRLNDKRNQGQYVPMPNGTNYTLDMKEVIRAYKQATKE